MNRTVAVAAALLLASCRPAPAPRRYEVQIRDMAFTPAQLTVAVGDTIVWVDHDIVPHTATREGVGGWDVGPIMGGDSAVLVVREAGTAAYHCRFHPVMQGTLLVQRQR